MFLNENMILIYAGYPIAEQQIFDWILFHISPPSFAFIFVDMYVANCRHITEHQFNRCSTSNIWTSEKEALCLFAHPLIWHSISYTPELCPMWHTGVPTRKSWEMLGWKVLGFSTLIPRLNIPECFGTLSIWVDFSLCVIQQFSTTNQIKVFSFLFYLCVSVWVTLVLDFEMCIMHMVCKSDMLQRNVYISLSGMPLCVDLIMICLRNIFVSGTVFGFWWG